MKKRVLSVVLTGALIAGLTGCTFSVGNSGDSSSSSDAAETTSDGAETADTEGGSGYPTEPVHVIVPFDAGGGADIGVRMISQYAEEGLGQTMVIDNVSGGSGTIGITQLANAEPDGYTIGYFASTNSNDSSLFDGITYDVDSFEPICQFAADPHIIVASKKSGITNMDQLVAAAKEKDGALSFGLGGAWTSHDFLRLTLQEELGISFNRMVYQGGAEAINAVASGDCDVAVPFVSEALAMIESGNVVPIAITSAERYEGASDIPTLQESGYDIEFTMWRGLVAPAGTPQDVIDKLVASYEAAFENEEYQTEAKEAGTFTEWKGGDNFKTFYEENHETYKDLIALADKEK